MGGSAAVTLVLKNIAACTFTDKRPAQGRLRELSVASGALELYLACDRRKKERERERERKRITQEEAHTTGGGVGPWPEQPGPG